MREAYIGFGGNLGDVAATFDKALTELLADGHCHLISSSSLYRSPPWGGVVQPDYLNAVVKIETSHTARKLLQRLMAVEQTHGRDRRNEVRWGARSLDLDLLLFGDTRITESDLEVPHPRMLERAFVLIPLLEIAPDLVLMDGTPLCDVVSPHSGAIMEVLDRHVQPERQNESDTTA